MEVSSETSYSVPKEGPGTTVDQPLGLTHVCGIPYVVGQSGNWDFVRSPSSACGVGDCGTRFGLLRQTSIPSSILWNIG